MREIVSVHAGQCGNRLGARFWEALARDHGVDPAGERVGATGPGRSSERIEVYFDECRQGRFAPRAAMVDLEPGALDAVRAGPFGAMFRPQDLFVSSFAGAGNNWARGHYTDGADLADCAMDIVRRQAESCDALQGFQFVHSLGGGTGAGTGTLLLRRIRDEYPDRMLLTFSVCPSPKVSDCVVEPYNATLALRQLLEHASACVVLDNEALYDVCFRKLKLSKPTYADLDYLASQAMAGVTCGLRHPGPTLRSLFSGLIPFPRLKFFVTALAPLYSRGSTRCYPPGLELVMERQFEQSNVLCAAPLRYGRLLAGLCQVRGPRVTQAAVDEALKSVASRYYCVNWMDRVGAVVHAMPNAEYPTSSPTATAMLNSTAIAEVWRRVGEQFSTMFRRKAFLHWYTGEGMDEMEFTEAESNMNDLVSEYQQYQDATAEEEGEFDEDEEYDDMM